MIILGGCEIVIVCSLYQHLIPLIHREIVLLPWWSMLLLILKVNLMIGKTSRPNRSPRTSLSNSLVPISPFPEAYQDVTLWLWQSPAIVFITTPIFFMITNLSQNLVPTPAFMKLATAFGFNCSMDQFVGREKSAWAGNDGEQLKKYKYRVQLKKWNNKIELTSLSSFFFFQSEK